MLFDISLLAALQRDAYATHQQIGEQIHLSASQVSRRVQRLQAAGIIRRYVALLDPAAVGLGVRAITYVTLTRHSEGAVEAFERMVATCPEIMECASTTGESDYLIKVVVADMKAYDRFLQERLFRQSGVASVRSSVVLREVKYETALPV